MKTILSIEGYDILISEIDFEQLNQYKWHTKDSWPYCYRYIGTKPQLIIRDLLGDCGPVEFLDFNKLNCQRHNIIAKNENPNKWCCSCKLWKPKFKTVYCTECDRAKQSKARREIGAKERHKRDPELIKQGLKLCLKCNQVLLLSEFSPCKRGYAGVSCYCVPCQIKNVDKVKRNSYVRKYRSNNPNYLMYHRNQQQKRRAKKISNGDSDVTTAFLRSLVDIDICYYCNQSILIENRTIDHKIPIFRGGLHVKDNLVMSCQKCNSSKSIRTQEEYKNNVSIREIKKNGIQM